MQIRNKRIKKESDIDRRHLKRKFNPFCVCVFFLQPRQHSHDWMDDRKSNIPSTTAVGRHLENKREVGARCFI